MGDSGVRPILGKGDAVAPRFPIRHDQGATFFLPLRIANRAAGIVGVTAGVNPTVTTDVPHGLAPGDVVVVSEVVGAAGINNADAAPEWVVATVPTTTTLTLTAPAPGVYVSGGVLAVPQDLSGYVARMQVRVTHDAPAVVLEATLANGRVSLGTPPGGTVPNQVSISVPAAVTAALTPNSYRYDVELESPGGFVLRVMEGPFTVRPEVTR